MDSEAAAEEQARQFCDGLAAEAWPLESRLLAELYHYCHEGEAGQVVELSRQMEEMYSARKPFGSLTRWVEQVREPMLRRRVASLRQRFQEFQGDRELQRKLDRRVEESLKEGLASGVRMLPYRQPTDCGDQGLEPLRETDRKARRERFLERHGSSGRRAELLAEIFALRGRLEQERSTEGEIEFDPEQHIQAAVESAVPVPQLLAGLRLETDAAYGELLERRAQRLGLSKLEWWDFLYEPGELSEPLSPEPGTDAQTVTRRTLASIGFQVEGLGIALHAEPRPGGPSLAYRFPVQVPGDVRVVVRHEPGLRGIELLLHELGHALYTSQIEQEVWEFRSPAGTALTEAVGQLLTRFCRQPEWLTGEAGLEPERARRMKALLAEQDLLRLRLGLVLARFEELAQGQGLAELDGLWRELTSSMLRIEPGEPGLYTWASVQKYVLHPGHWQNLMLAELIAAQLWTHYSRHLGPLVGNEALGRRLARDVFRHGARYPWPQLLQKITGQQLGTEALVRQISET